MPRRLMAALLYLKHAFNLSDEELIASWSENVVRQHFSDAHYTMQQFPYDATHTPALREAAGITVKR